jgi:hypothetical protein
MKVSAIGMSQTPGADRPVNIVILNGSNKQAV